MSSSLLLPTPDVAAPAAAGLSDPAGLITSFADDAASTESSSIGSLSSDDEDEDRGSDEAVSKSSGKDDGTATGSSSLGSLSSLEDALPIK